nr:hypothetical protein [Nitrosomonas nitrosa]
MATQLAVVPPTIKQLTQTIISEWHRAEKAANTVVEAFVRIGGCILDAEKQLGMRTADYHGFIATLPFSHSHAVKFKKLAGNPIISKKSNWRQLPSSIYSLYQLALVDPQELQANLDARIITPQTTRTQIAQIKQQDTYQPFCTILVASSVLPQDRSSLIASASQALAKYPNLKIKLSKGIRTEGLAHLRMRAEKSYNRLVEKFPPKDRRLTSLVERAIESARKSPQKLLPIDWEQRDRLKQDLGIDIAQEVRESTLYIAARQHQVVCRFLSYAKLDPELKLWTAVIAWCDTGNPKKLQQLAKEKIQGKTKTQRARKKAAITQAQHILKEYCVFLAA